jgi:F0F1-type ATP synthase assembly protein I
MVQRAREDRRELWNGFGSGLQMAVELAAVPLLFGLLGGLIDRWIGSTPICTIALLCFAFAGTGIKSYYAYMAKVQEEEKDKPWNRSTR